MSESRILITVLNMSFSAGFVILAVLVCRWCIRSLPKIFSYGLWMVVLFRLLCPVSIESAFSILPVSVHAIPEKIEYMGKPRIASGIGVIDHAVNSSLPSATPMYSVNPMQILLFIAEKVWIIGAAALLLYGVISCIILWRKLRNARKISEEGVYVAENLKTPFVLGMIRPRIYLPEGLTEQETAYILLHERTHIRRLDYVVKAIAYLALCLHWFNPLVWAAFICIGKDMEMCCDEAVLRKMGSGAKEEYSTILLSLAAGKHLFPAAFLAFGEGEVKGRVKNILSFKKLSVKMTIFWCVVVVLVCVMLGLNPITSDAISDAQKKEGSVPEWISNAWNYRTPYVGAASDVGNIIGSWDTLYDASFCGFQLFTAQEPYGARIHYQISQTSELSPQETAEHYGFQTEGNVLVLFALVQNLDYAEISYDVNSYRDAAYNGEVEEDFYKDSYIVRYERADFEEQAGNLWDWSEQEELLAEMYFKWMQKAPHF